VKEALNYLKNNLDSITEKVLTNLEEALIFRRTFSVERSLQDSLQHRWCMETSRAPIFDKFN
jgi:hypothetical protein